LTILKFFIAMPKANKGNSGKKDKSFNQLPKNKNANTSKSGKEKSTQKMEYNNPISNHIMKGGNTEVLSIRQFIKGQQTTSLSADELNTIEQVKELTVSKEDTTLDDHSSLPRIDGLSAISRNLKDNYGIIERSNLTVTNEESNEVEDPQPSTSGVEQPPKPLNNGKEGVPSLEERAQYMLENTIDSIKQINKETREMKSTSTEKKKSKPSNVSSSKPLTNVLLDDLSDRDILYLMFEKMVSVTAIVQKIQVESKEMKTEMETLKQAYNTSTDEIKKIIKIDEHKHKLITQAVERLDQLSDSLIKSTESQIKDKFHTLLNKRYRVDERPKNQTPVSVIKKEGVNVVNRMTMKDKKDSKMMTFFRQLTQKADKTSYLPALQKFLNRYQEGHTVSPLLVYENKNMYVQWLEGRDDTDIIRLLVTGPGVQFSAPSK